MKNSAINFFKLNFKVINHVDVGNRIRKNTVFARKECSAFPYALSYERFNALYIGRSLINSFIDFWSVVPIRSSIRVIFLSDHVLQYNIVFEHFFFKTLWPLFFFFIILDHPFSRETFDAFNPGGSFTRVVYIFTFRFVQNDRLLSVLTF